jgi:hypothetical protein
MRCKVYRSLDRPSSFFGIRGRFMVWLLLMAGAGLLLAFPVGVALSGIAGFAVFFICVAAAYLWVVSIQEKSSDREFSMRILSRRYPRYYRLRPQPFTALWRAGN